MPPPSPSCSRRSRRRGSRARPDDRRKVSPSGNRLGWRVSCYSSGWTPSSEGERQQGGNHVTVHGIVIAFLLLFPWGLVGVVIVGATASAVKRGLAHLQRAGWVLRRGEPALSPPEARKWEHPASSLAGGRSSVAQQGGHDAEGRLNQTQSLSRAESADGQGQRPVLAEPSPSLRRATAPRNHHAGRSVPWRQSLHTCMRRRRSISTRSISFRRPIPGRAASPTREM